MIKHLGWSASFAVALCLFLGGTAGSAAGAQVAGPRIKYKDGSSTNWSGYAIETNLTKPARGAVSDVQGSWVVPTVACGSANTYSASWVGIDGYSDNTVEQTGTEQDCANGAPRYYAWYEMYPKRSFTINMRIAAGDVLSAEVAYLGSNNFRLTLRDMTSGAAFSTVQKENASRESAEWIMEAPSGGGVLPLANFGTIQFANAVATLNGHTGGIGDGAWQKDGITMVNASGAPEAIPSALSVSGDAFGVTWQSSN